MAVASLSKVPSPFFSAVVSTVIVFKLGMHRYVAVVVPQYFLTRSKTHRLSQCSQIFRKIIIYLRSILLPRTEVKMNMKMNKTIVLVITIAAIASAANS